MNPQKLKANDKVAIVSLSSGVLGESFVDHELKLGEQRLKEFELIPVYMPNSKKGIQFLKDNPKARADDLKQAFKDPEIKAIICAIGGNDTHRTLPYLLNDEEFKNLVKNNPKIFLGFSDSTTNHLMFFKLGLNTFYGQAYLPDIAELDTDMHQYTKQHFKNLFNNISTYEIKPSDEWFEDRSDYSPNAVGTPKISHKNTGYELIKGTTTVQGELLGGCLDVMGNYIMPTDDPELQNIIKNYNVFPTLEEWKNKIMFIETSDQKLSPTEFRKHILKLKELNVFDQINGLLVGKPYDNVFYDEYKQILLSELEKYNFPILYNINIGHAYPHAILPYGALTQINSQTKTLTILKNTLS